MGKDIVLNVFLLYIELCDFDGMRDSREFGYAVSYAVVLLTACVMVNVMMCLFLVEVMILNVGVKLLMCSCLVIIVCDSVVFKVFSGFVVFFGFMEASIRDEE